MTVWIFQGAVLHGLSIEQYNWPSGFASNISIMLHSSHWIELQGERAAGVASDHITAVSVEDGGSVAVWEAEEKPVHTGNITLFIKKVFGGDTSGTM